MFLWPFNQISWGEWSVPRCYVLRCEL